MSEREKILVIGLSNLGDAILTYPALAVLWRAFPQGEFHVLASPRTKELFAGDSRFAQVWIWEKKTPVWKQAARVSRLAAAGYSHVVDFRNSLIPLFLPGVKRTPICRRRAPEGEHRTATHLRLLSSLGLSPSNEPVCLPFGPKEESRVKGWVQAARPLVLMVPGARSHLKRWRAEGFAEAADRLADRHHAQVILLGEPAERGIAEAVRQTMKQPVTNLAGHTSVRELAALLARAKLLITNDSASLHAAEVMGVPTVAIFGPTDESKYGPRHPRSIVIRRTLVCAPCGLALCPTRHECMQWVTAEEVFSAASKILAGSVSVRPEPFDSAAHPELVEGERPAQDRLVEGPDS